MLDQNATSMNKPRLRKIGITGMRLKDKLGDFYNIDDLDGFCLGETNRILMRGGKWEEKGEWEESVKKVVSHGEKTPPKLSTDRS